jgi:hypothetical protein
MEDAASQRAPGGGAARAGRRPHHVRSETGTKNRGRIGQTDSLVVAMTGSVWPIQTRSIEAIFDSRQCGGWSLYVAPGSARARTSPRGAGGQQIGSHDAGDTS